MSLRGRRHGGGAARLVMITASGPLTGTFDPSITTATSTTITCDYGDGTSETLTGTTHNFSHTYAALGNWRAVFRGVPLHAITAIYAGSDVITGLANLRRLTALQYLSLWGNPAYTLYLSDVSKSALSITANALTKCEGSLAQLGTIYTTLELDGTAIIGSLADLCALSQTIKIFGCTGITPASIAHLTAIRDLRIYSMGWDQAGVDLVLMSIGNAILADAAHFTYATPSIQIGGATNAAPSGTYRAPSGPGGTITSGLEAIWVMVHNTGHVWTVTCTGSGPY